MSYKAESHGFIVSVVPKYFEEQSSPDENEYLWGYRIRIENRSEKSVQLINRHWDITDALGKLEVVDGPGIVGKKPRLVPGSTFDYQSFCALKTTSGFMVGRYEMVDESSGEHFWIDVPAFSLDSPFEPKTVN